VAVTQRRTIEFRPWNAFADPALPEGSWFASLTIAHAGGGGLVTAEVIFQEVGDPLSARLYSLETMTFDNLLASGASVIEVRTINLETFQRVAVFNQSISLILTNNPISGRSIDGRAYAVFPWFLGAPRLTGSAGLDILAQDNGVGDRSNMLLSGYFWGPAARNASGGPQRPTTGLFGP